MSHAHHHSLSPCHFTPVQRRTATWLQQVRLALWLVLATALMRFALSAVRTPASPALRAFQPLVRPHLRTHPYVPRHNPFPMVQPPVAGRHPRRPHPLQAWAARAAAYSTQVPKPLGEPNLNDSPHESTGPDGGLSKAITQPSDSVWPRRHPLWWLCLGASWHTALLPGNRVVLPIVGVGVGVGVALCWALRAKGARLNIARHDEVWGVSSESRGGGGQRAAPVPHPKGGLEHTIDRDHTHRVCAGAFRGGGGQGGIIKRLVRRCVAPMVPCAVCDLLCCPDVVRQRRSRVLPWRSRRQNRRNFPLRHRSRGCTVCCARAARKEGCFRPAFPDTSVQAPFPSSAALMPTCSCAGGGGGLLLCR